jgi:hypothetical protein
MTGRHCEFLSRLVTLCGALAGLTAIFLWAISSTAQSQISNSPSQEAKHTRAELRQDFAILRAALEEGHAGLYRYSTRKEMDMAFDRALKEIDRDMTTAEFYAVVTSLSNNIKCGHTQIVLPKESRKYLEENGKQLPLKVRFIDGRAFVLASVNSKIEPGSELLSINGRRVHDVAESILRHLPGDGDIETGKYRALGDKFGWYYFLFVEKTESFAISYLDPFHRNLETTLAGLTGKELKASLQFNNAQAASDGKPWRYELMSSPGVARLKVETFAPPENGIDGQTFVQFLESSFRKVASDKIEDLILDLRGNDGGEDYGPTMYSYIADGEFDVYSSVEAATDRLPLISRYSKLSADFQTNFASQLQPSNGGRFLVSKQSQYYIPTQHPSTASYRGKVWVLVDGEVFSSGTVFCSLAKSHKRGTFVGEETGGAYQGFNAGELVVITLPASQLRVVIPLLRFTITTGPVPNARRGILPDKSVQPSLENMLQGGDAELPFTLKLIAERRSQAEKAGAGR